MYHSVNFGTINSWTDWKLVPSSRPVVLPPEVKTKIIDIPGGDGVIDLTESLTGYPVYNNREGNIVFTVVNDFSHLVDTYDWTKLYESVLNSLHGKRTIMVLEDDPEFYYEGRFNVIDPKMNKNYSNLTIGYNVSPYKKSLRDTLNNWTADPFGISSTIEPITGFSNLSVTTAYGAHTFTQAQVGSEPVCPSFVVSSTSGNGITVKYTSTSGEESTANIPDGEYSVSNLVFRGNTNTIYFKCGSGTATVSIRLRQGWL